MDSAKNVMRSAKRDPRQEKIVGFSPINLSAPIFLRGAAFLADYILLVSLPLLWLILSTFFGEQSSSPGLSVTIWVITIIAFLIDFILLPLLIGKTVGKFIFGLSIVKIDGGQLDLKSLLLRNTLGYLISILTLGLGFLLAVFTTKSRALHDIISGTIVIRGKRVKVV